MKESKLNNDAPCEPKMNEADRLSLLHASDEK
jgi:hypothetical protein